MRIALLIFFITATQGIISLQAQEAATSRVIKIELPGELDYRYVGFIAAQEQGFFKDAGFNVVLSFGSNKESIKKRILQGETHFSVCGSEIVLDHQKGLPVIATAAFFQRSPWVLVMGQNEKESTWLKNKKGSRVILEQKIPIQIQAMLTKNDMSLEDFVIERNVSDKFAKMESGEVEGIEVNLLNDSYRLKQMNMNYHTYTPEFYGVELYDQVLYTSRDTYTNLDKKIDSFNEALKQGWSYAIQNKEEMFQYYTNKYGFIDSDSILINQHWVLENRLIFPKLVEIGRMKKTRWSLIQGLYIQQGLLPENFYSDSFYHKKEKLKRGLLSTYYIEISIVTFLAFFALVIMCIFNRKLMGMVNRRTNELAEVNWQLSKFNEELEEKIHNRTQQLEAALERAEVANKAKSTFLANMTHEIRTPMNSILGFAQIMKEKTLDQDMVKYLDTINSSGQSLLRIINDVLDLSRVESGKFTLDYSRFNILRLIEEAMTLFSEEILAKNLNLKFDHVDECPEFVYLDKDRLRQVLTNIIGNAVKFTEDGLIEVKLTLEMVGPKDADVIIEVKDTGIGIAEKNLDLIFGEFEQVDDIHLHYGGTGLGLAISKRLVEMMNGTLSVKSEEGRGSDFKIKLRKVGIVDQEDQSKDVQKKQFYFEPAKVMIVDECKVTRDLFEAYLSVTRLTVKTYSSSFDALKDLEHYKPDLVIAEINLRSMDGFQLAEEIKAVEGFHKTPIIAISSITHTGSRQKFRIFNGFLKKPISVNEFYTSISHFLPCQQVSQKFEVKEVHVEGHEPPSESLSFTKYINKEIRDKCAEIMKYQVINDYQNLLRILKCIDEEKNLKDLKGWLEEYQKNLDVFNFDALNRQIEYLMNSKDSTSS